MPGCDRYNAAALQSSEVSPRSLLQDQLVERQIRHRPPKPRVLLLKILHPNLDFSRPCKPTDNAFTEALNSKLRSKCLNARWFLSLQDTYEKLEAWRRHYHEERPHSAIGNIPPIMLANSAGETSPSELGRAKNSRPERYEVGWQSNLNLVW